MRLWRVSDFADLSGNGGLLVSGRWHARGRRIVYLSDHPASALLELMVHLEIDPADLPASFQLLTVEAADNLASEFVEHRDLSDDWRDMPDETQAVGGRWLAKGRTVLLRVPSAIMPFASNWLLNPAHPDMAKIRITDVRTVRFDPRLLD